MKIGFRNFQMEIAKNTPRCLLNFYLDNRFRWVNKKALARKTC